MNKDSGSLDLFLWCTEALWLLLSCSHPGDPCQCRSPSVLHQGGNWRCSLSFKRCPSAYRMSSEERGDICGCFPADATVPVQEPGLQHFLSSTRSLGHLGPTCHFDPCPPSGNFYQQPQEDEEFSFNGHTGICQSYQVCIFIPPFHILKDPKSRLIHFSLAKEGRRESRNKI